MNALLVNLTLESPLLLTGVSNGEENSGRTLPYIPGSALRGVLVERYQAVKEDLLEDETAVRLFFSGAVRFLNAYPKVFAGRSLPLPASWYKEKGADEKDAEVADFALKPDDTKNTRLSGKFWRMSGDGNIGVMNSSIDINLHIGDEKRGTKQKGASTIFEYESLAAGQTFIAAILAEQADDLALILGLLEKQPKLLLGRSRSAGYGHIRLKCEPDSKGWQESESILSGDLVTITFLSDAILRDENGQPSLDVDASLSKHFGRPVRNVRAFIRPTLIGGFNRKWSLPLPQAPAVGMGSVLVYRREDVQPAELESLMARGIGERRVEGFGRFAVNHHAQETFKLSPVSESNAIQTPILSAVSQSLAQAMADRLLRRKIEDALLEGVQKLEVRGAIQNHPLARLRSALRRALRTCDEQAFQELATFLDKLKSTARDQLERARVSRKASSSERGDRLWEWVHDRLKDRDGLIFLEIAKVSLPRVAGQEARMTEDLKREYTLRLIEAVVDGKIKDNRQEKKA